MITVYGENITLDQLCGIPVERPNGAGRAWKGIAHADLAYAILDEIRSRKWTCGGHKFSLGAAGADMVGAFDLAIPDIPAPDGQTLSLGVVTSNAQKTALTLLVGTTVRVCTNGMATGEIVLRSKHTKRFDLYAGIERGLDEYARRATVIADVVAALRETKLGDRKAEHLLIESGRQGLMPWSRVGRVDAVYRSEAHRAMHGAGTAWSLLNAFTDIVKMNPPWHQMRQMNGFRGLLLGQSS